MSSIFARVDLPSLPDIAERLPSAVERLLLPVQVEHARKIYTALKVRGGVADGSDTGTGKTFVACAVAKALDVHVVVICPLSVIRQWQEVADLFGIEVYVQNYEQLITGKHVGVVEKFMYRKKPVFRWKLTKGSLIIVDEAHRVKNPKAQATRMVAALGDDYRVLFLSATIGDKVHDLGVMSAITGMCERQKFAEFITHFGGFYKNMEKGSGRFVMALQNKEGALRLHKHMRSYGFLYRMRRGDNPEWKKCTINAYPVTVDQSTSKNIDGAYTEIERMAEGSAVANIKNLHEVVQKLLEIETMKVDTLAKMATEAVDAGMSVVIFVNYTATAKALEKKFGKKAVSIRGDTPQDTRELNKAKFQIGNVRIMVCNSRAGGVGLSLHDETGEYPRMSIISPSFSGVELKQVLGRVDRVGSKTAPVQKIVFIAGTKEEKIYESVKKKINNIDTINDGDLTPDFLRL